MFFTANDSIKLNMSRDDAIKLFEKTFYDMHKAGYTLSTRIIHTDYNGKKFTGFRQQRQIYRTVYRQC